MKRKVQAAWLVLLISLPSYAAAGVVVTRRVVADDFAPPVSSSGNPACPQSVARPKPGDEVRLVVAGQAARRDEPSLSVIVRLDAAKAYLLHHASRTYSELPYPPEARHLETPFRESMGPAAAEVFPFAAEGPLQEASGRIGDLAVLHRSRGINSLMLGRRDVELEVSTSPEGAAAAFAAEGLLQAVRNGGEAWLALLGPASGLPLGLAETLHQPEVRVRYAEQFVGIDRTEVSEALFAPPTDYRKVDHVPDCF